MTPWSHALQRSLVSGSIASVASTAALAVLGQREQGSACAATNATSHWFHGDEAFARNDFSAGHTLLGYATHHAGAVFWAVLYEKWFGDRAPQRSFLRNFGNAAAVSALAAFIDYVPTPKRLTPGFEQRLSRRSMVLVYGAIAAGLALAGTLRRVRRPPR